MQSRTRRSLTHDVQHMHDTTAPLLPGVRQRAGKANEVASAARARTDVRLLDHADVVGAVADRERHAARALDELHDLRLLLRRHAAADDGGALHADLRG